MQSRLLGEGIVNLLGRRRRRHKLRTGVENSLVLLWFLRWIGVIARLVHPYNSDQTLYAKHNYRNKYRNSLVVDSLKDKE